MARSVSAVSRVGFAGKPVRRAQPRPSHAQWHPMFSNGIRVPDSLDRHLFEFGRNVGRFCTIVPETWDRLENDCDWIVDALSDAKGAAGAASARLVEYLEKLPPNRRENPTLSIHCDVTAQENLRCQVFANFGGNGGPPGFTDAPPFEMPQSYFLYVRGLRRVLGSRESDLQPVIGDIAALIVITFEECLDVFRKHFRVEVATAPALRREWGGPHPSKRVNLGLVVETPAATAAREAEMARLDEIEKSDGLLASFASTFPKGSPEQFVLFVEAAPAKESRISVVRNLGGLGYVSVRPDFRDDLLRSRIGEPARFRFDNRNLMSLVEQLAKSLDRGKPGWRDDPASQPPKRFRLNTRSRR